MIKNAQRDLNIALINELPMIFNKICIDTQAVVEASGSKLNFLPLCPGLVVGHCIGVDPYYLTYKAKAIGYHPEIILAGRRLNDGMGAYVAAQLIKAIIKKSIRIEGARVLVMGLTFKENCPDLRNTRVVDIISELKDYQCQVDVHVPWVDAAEPQAEYGIALADKPDVSTYDTIILAVAHDAFKKLGAEHIHAIGKPLHVLYDLKYLVKFEEAEIRLIIG